MLCSCGEGNAGRCIRSVLAKVLTALQENNRRAPKYSRMHEIQPLQKHETGLSGGTLTALLGAQREGG